MLHGAYVVLWCGVQVMKKKPKKGAKPDAKPLTKTEPVDSFFNFFNPPQVRPLVVVKGGQAGACAHLLVVVLWLLQAPGCRCTKLHPTSC
jgi:hypothetical protein